MVLDIYSNSICSGICGNLEFVSAGEAFGRELLDILIQYVDVESPKCLAPRTLCMAAVVGTGQKLRPNVEERI